MGIRELSRGFGANPAYAWMESGKVGSLMQMILAAIGVFFTATSAFSTVIFCRAARAGHAVDARLSHGDNPDMETEGHLPASISR